MKHSISRSVFMISDDFYTKSPILPIFQPDSRRVKIVLILTHFKQLNVHFCYTPTPNVHITYRVTICNEHYGYKQDRSKCSFTLFLLQRYQISIARNWFGSSIRLCVGSGRVYIFMNVGGYHLGTTGIEWISIGLNLSWRCTKMPISLWKLQELV